MDDVAKIARGLTAAGKAALLKAKRGFCAPQGTLSVHTSPATEAALRRRGLIEANALSRLTPLGRSVRECLERQALKGPTDE